METYAPVRYDSAPGLRVGPKVWGIREAGLGIALAFVALLVIGAAIVGPVMAITGETSGTAVTTAGVVSSIIFDGVLVAIAYLFVARRHSLSWAALGFGTDALKWWWVPPVAAVAALFAVGTYTFAMREIGAGGLAPDQEIDDLFETTALLPIVGLFTVFIAPVTEETFFRGFVFPGLIRRLGVWGAVVVSGTLFGAAHISSADTVGLVIPIGAIGAFFAWIYYRTASIWPSIGAHLLFNGVSFFAGVLGAAQ